MENVSTTNTIEYTLFRGRKVRDFSYLTIGEALDKYNERREERCSPATVARYDEHKRIYFNDILQVPLLSIDDDFLQKKVDQLCKSLAPKTVINAYNHLHSVLEEFLPDHYWRVILPDKVPIDYYIPDTNEVKTLVNSANDDILVPILLAAYGGLRRSEVCGLQISDFTSKGVHIQRAVVYDKHKHPCIKCPKTKAGYRFVPLPGSVIFMSKRWNYYGMLPNTLSKKYEKTIKKLDMPYFSFHKLRHYWASDLHAHGVPDQYICKVGGWKSPETLQRIYQHALRDKEREFNNMMVSIFDDEISKAL